MADQQARGLQVLFARFAAVEGGADLAQREVGEAARLIAGGGAQEVLGERDMPLDRGGLSQQFVYALVQRAFDLIDDPEPFTPLRRATPASP